MHYMKLAALARQELLADLEAMPAFLEETFAGLGAERIRLQGPGGLFSPVEQVWHLADLENEGFGARIDRLRGELNPSLPDFDGAAVAAARNYRILSLADGLTVFKTARVHNLQKLSEIPNDAWQRSGTQEGVGRVSLCDIPSMMRQHDAAHKEEIAHWHASVGTVI